MANAFSAGFHRFIHRFLAVPVGSRERATRYRHLRTAWSVGKWPRALTALRNLALRDPDRVRRADHAADVDVVAEEGCELFSRGAP
jgi:hypothetical protein